MQPLVAAAAFAAYTFVLYENRTVLGRHEVGGHGGVGLQGDVAGLRAEDCQRSCAEDVTCTCIVHAHRGGSCSKRRSCTASSGLLPDLENDVYVKMPARRLIEVLPRPGTAARVLAGVPAAAPAPAAAVQVPGQSAAHCESPLPPTCTFPEPQKLVNLTMIVENVVYKEILAQPSLKQSLEHALKVTIALKAGHGVTHEDVLVELSSSELFPPGLFPPGGMVLLIVVSPHSVADTPGVSQALRSVDLSKILSQTVATIVAFSKASTGAIAVKHVHVFPAGGSIWGTVWLDAEGTGQTLWLAMSESKAAMISANIALLLACLLCCCFCKGRSAPPPERRCKPDERETSMISAGNDCQGLLDEIPGAANGGLPVHFLDLDGDKRVLWFTCRTLGLFFAKDDPTRVTGFPVGSTARKKGVHAGWRIVQVGETPVPKACTGQEVMRCIALNTAELDPWTLKMDFETRRGEPKTVYFTEGPLGMEFEQVSRLPVIVDSVQNGSAAKQRGVQRGWSITGVCDIDLRKETDFKKVLKCIVEAVSQLPTANATGSMVQSTGSASGSEVQSPRWKGAPQQIRA